MNKSSPSPDWHKQADSIQFDPRAFIGGDNAELTGQNLNQQEAPFTTINPATETPLADFTDGGATQIDQAVTAARAAFKTWRHYPPDNRKNLLLNLADKILEEKNTLALLDSLEMGMPIAMSLDQVEGFLRYNAEKSTVKSPPQTMPPHWRYHSRKRGELSVLSHLGTFPL